MFSHNRTLYRFTIVGIKFHREIRWVVIVQESRFFINKLLNVLLFLANRIHWIIILSSYPQRIEMRVSWEDVCHMHCTFILTLEGNDTMSETMASCVYHLNTRIRFHSILIELHSLLIIPLIHRPIRRLTAYIRIEKFLPFILLNIVRCIRKHCMPLTISKTCSMIEMHVRHEHHIDVFRFQLMFL